MAYTLADYARLALPDYYKAGVIDILAVNSVPLSMLSFEDAGRLDIEILRTKALPTVGTRKIGGTWTSTKGTTDSIKERIVNIGNSIDIDKLLVKAKSVVDQRALQESLFTKAISLRFSSIFINGNPSTDYDDLTGIRYRLINDMPSGQTVLGGGIDVSPDSTTLDADKLKLIDFVHELIDVTGAGKSDYLFMNREMKMRLGSALRRSGMLATTEDIYGRKFDTFGTGGPAIVDIGSTDPLDRTARIIGNLETDDGSAISGGDATSIYSCRVGEEYLNGFQEYALDVQDKGLLEDGVTYRTVIDWPLGIYTVSPFALARLVGIVAA